MEYSIVDITTGPLHDIGRKIFAHLDANGLLRVRSTCTAWYNLIESSPKLWPAIVLKARRKYQLIHPLWKQVQKDIPVEHFIELGYHLMEYQWKNYKRAELKLHEAHCIAILYGDLERLIFFWPYLQNKQHPQVILDFVARFGLVDVLKFLLKHLTNLDFYLTGINSVVGTPLHEAAANGHVETVKVLLPYFTVLPIGFCRCPIYCAKENGYDQTAKLIQNWFASDCTFPVKCLTDSTFH